MTVSVTPQFGPYAFALTPAEAEAATARLRLRIALNRGSTASRLAPLTLFAMVVLLATVLALTGIVSRRQGELALILAAAAFAMQRLITRLSLRDAERDARSVMASLEPGPALMTIDPSGVTLAGGVNTLRLDFGDCEEAEKVGGLVYLWPYQGAPIVLSARALPEGEADQLVAEMRRRVGATRSLGSARMASLLRG